MKSVTIKPPMTSVARVCAVMLSIIMLCVVMLSVILLIVLPSYMHAA
jgi:hypothetical protein